MFDVQYFHEYFGEYFTDLDRIRVVNPLDYLCHEIEIEIEKGIGTEIEKGIEKEIESETETEIEKGIEIDVIESVIGIEKYFLDIDHQLDHL